MFASGILASLLASWIYGFLVGIKEYRRLKHDGLLNRRFHLYFYDSSSVRRPTDANLYHSVIEITRNWAGKLNHSFSDATDSETATTKYEYSGPVNVKESQIHLKLEGVNHRETGYAILDRPLGVDDILFGIILVTSNDFRKEPIGIRCILSPAELTENGARLHLQSPAYVSPPDRS